MDRDTVHMILLGRLKPQVAVSSDLREVGPVSPSMGPVPHVCSSCINTLRQDEVFGAAGYQ